MRGQPVGKTAHEWSPSDLTGPDGLSNGKEATLCLTVQCTRLISVFNGEPTDLRSPRPGLLAAPQLFPHSTVLEP